jgi:hypothetical protein
VAAQVLRTVRALGVESGGFRALHENCWTAIMFTKRCILPALLGFLTIATGCDKPKSGSDSPSVTSATVEPAGSPGVAAAEAERMPYCPSVVPGATTLVSSVPGGIEVRVTASATDAVSEIRRRADFLVGASAQEKGKHDSNGSGGGRYGRCPVVMRNTALESRSIPGGAAVTIKPGVADELDWLRREVEERSAELSHPVEFGHGIMKTCPNATLGAATTVTNAAYGVDMVVTAQSPEAVTEIRTRARELAKGAKPENDKRCPAAVDGTTVDVEDVPGGAKLAIKGKPDAIAVLQREVRERSLDFEAPERVR